MYYFAITFLFIMLKTVSGQTNDDDCQLPKVSGNCEALMPKWYFDVASGRCTPFNYGGCGGNANNFKSKIECQLACERKYTISPITDK